jgi:serine/threonine protein kinase
VIEEFIEGRTIEEVLEEGPIPERKAVEIVNGICRILDQLHNLPTPIIHRDIKPSNVILSPQDEVYLLDMNVAKWYDPDQADDTRYMGTQYYAAPEQVGYGLSASSAKSDIYTVGMLLNVMITGHFPKEERAPGKIWDVIERCISLDADRRYSAAELAEALEELRTDEMSC